MTYNIDGNIYNVIIDKKNNKNTYIRVKEDLTIYVTTNYLISNKQILKLLDENKDYLKKVLSKRLKSKEKEEYFYFLGAKYDIITVPTIDNIDIENNKIYVKNIETLNKWLKKQIELEFNERLNINVDNFSEKIKKPILKIRKMKSRWGVYNRKNHSVTLNSKLIEYDETIIDYVVIHELSHIIHFDHSANFWKLVEINYPNYKKARKILKD